MKKEQLQFETHKLSTAINNLNFSCIYHDLEDENLQHYIKMLVKTIREVNLIEFIND